MSTLFSLLDAAEQERINRLNAATTNRQSFIAWANTQLADHIWNLRKDPTLTGTLRVDETPDGLVVNSNNPRLQSEAHWLLYNVTFVDNDQRWVFISNAVNWQLSTEDDCPLVQAINTQMKADKLIEESRVQESQAFKENLQKKTAALVEKMNKVLKQQRFRQWRTPDGSKSVSVKLTVEDAEHSIYLYAGKAYVARESAVHSEQYIYSTFAKALDQVRIYRDRRGDAND